MGKYSQKKKKTNWKKKTLTGLCVVLSLVLAVMIAGTVYYESILGKIHRPGNLETLSREEMDLLLQEDVAQATGEPVEDDDLPEMTRPELIQTGPDVLNIMLVGQDARPGEKPSRSDTMILCTIRKSTGTVTLTSFLRDTYVKIPGYGKAKMNVAYRVGGMKKLAATMLENFGVRVDYTVEVSFSGFSDVIEAIGGVDIELTEQEANRLNRPGGAERDEDNSRWDLKAGMNHLNGQQALAYARIRKIDSDFKRTERQRKVLTAVLDKVRDLNLLQINSLVNKLVSMISTDMTNAQITACVLEYFPLLSDVELISQRIPQDNTYRYSTIKGAGDCVIIDFKENIEFLKQTIGG